MPSLPPPPPEKPDPYECCGSGCTPCIYDYYYDQLDKWELENGISLQQYFEKKSKLAHHKDDR